MCFFGYKIKTTTKLKRNSGINKAGSNFDKATE